MAFSGLSTNKHFTANTAGEDISPIIARLALHASPFLDWVGDANVFAISTKHEFIEDQIRPLYLTTSTVINSTAGANLGIQLKDKGESLTVGTILENTSATAELMQVVSVVGASSVLVSRSYDGGMGSLAAGQQLRVRWPAALEGADHNGDNAQILGNRRANTVGLFHIPVAVSGTALAINALGGDSFGSNRGKLLAEAPYRLEEAVLTGAVCSTGSLGSATLTRTMQGIRPQITAINSQVVVASFATAGYLGPTALRGLFEAVFDAGGDPNDEWALVCGRTTFGDISNLNATRVNVIQGAYDDMSYTQQVTVYNGPFGSARVILTRALEPTDCLLVAKPRIKVVPLQGRNFTYTDIAKSGDNTKGLIVGEYTVEVHHPSAMGRIRANG